MSYPKYEKHFEISVLGIIHKIKHNYGVKSHEIPCLVHKLFSCEVLIHIYFDNNHLTSIRIQSDF